MVADQIDAKNRGKFYSTRSFTLARYSFILKVHSNRDALDRRELQTVRFFGS